MFSFSMFPPTSLTMHANYALSGLGGTSSTHHRYSRCPRLYLLRYNIVNPACKPRGPLIRRTHVRCHPPEDTGPETIHAADAACIHEPLPILLLIAKARLSALEDFRAVAAALHASPMQGTAPRHLLAAAAVHMARFVNPSLQPEEVYDQLQRVGDAAMRRSLQMRSEWLQEGDGRSEQLQSHHQHQQNEQQPKQEQQRVSEPARISGYGCKVEHQHAEQLALQLVALMREMGEGQGFACNHADLHDPANSCIDTMLTRRLGGCLSKHARLHCIVLWGAKRQHMCTSQRNAARRF